MKRISLFLAFSVFVFLNLVPPAFAAASKSISVRILSYNIKGLPKIAGGYRNESRFIDIGNRLKEMRLKGVEPDIVLLQESFVTETKAIRDLAGYKYMAKGPNEFDLDVDKKINTKLFDGGLYILSNHPIIVAKKSAFNKKYCQSWDCYSNKGVQAVKVRINGVPFDLSILNTHMQASQTHDSVRVLQMDQAIKFMEPFVSANEPVIFGGDFNSNPACESYHYWKAITSLVNVGEACLDSRECVVDPETDLDAVFATTQDQFFMRDGIVKANSRSSQTYNVRIRPFYLVRNFNEIVQGKMLSDHLGYEVGYHIQW